MANQHLGPVEQAQLREMMRIYGSERVRDALDYADMLRRNRLRDPADGWKFNDVNSDGGDGASKPDGGYLARA